MCIFVWVKGPSWSDWENGSGKTTILQMILGQETLVQSTIYLDLTSIQVMERALIHSPGAIIVVSHDRFFFDKVASRLLVFKREGEIVQQTGNWITSSIDVPGLS
jgi:ABC-type branched-subunit amino acid transport system ATPase component|tara:strand:+ start:298 stop:612 length:315 start_codon:yes stop_codon:yes gene_type:complete